MTQANPTPDIQSPNPDSERVKAFIIWLSSSEDNEVPAAIEFQADLEQARHTSPEECYKLLNDLPLRDKVRFSLINEFGAKFAQRPCFETITKRVVNLLSRPA